MSVRGSESAKRVATWGRRAPGKRRVPRGALSLLRGAPRSLSPPPRVRAVAGVGLCSARLEPRSPRGRLSEPPARSPSSRKSGLLHRGSTPPEAGRGLARGPGRALLGDRDSCAGRRAIVEPASVSRRCHGAPRLARGSRDHRRTARHPPRHRRPNLPTRRVTRG